ncbi:alpha/beta hydrolase [Salinisphaera sp. Q1T1-3]|uniref:alpha/beta hydrolase n=1 Tax=Salinisphaera sp. Q1T1-3 TaxID=2321229 RepID=UPI000E757837|nr:alpha/beta hydrolase [Salinisphaera sp. Q1T1-3]RJS93817.1 alpha/beta hydrolase [Salinisphaera sp. Q1T1-3]
MVDREDFEFQSHGTTCRAWFYPAQHDGREDAAGVPCIVMAHGLGGTRDAGLEPYAEAFAGAGFAVLLFDYRYFGASDGQPRQLLKVGAQLADWRAAVAAARKVEGIDPDRIGVWGTSFSGGHVIAVAAADDRIAAVIAQGPMLDGRASVLEAMRRSGLWHVIRLGWAAIRDHLANLAGAEPYRVPLVARPGQLAAMNTADAYDGYQAITPEDWRNEMTARLFLTLVLYRPGKRLTRLDCPALVQLCEADTVAPADASAALLMHADDHVIEQHFDIGHFEIYRGAGFRTAIAEQIDFCKRALARRR